MKAYKCDRCGKLYKDYIRKGGFSIACDKQYIALEATKFLDLCPACNAELQKWMGVGPLKDESEEEE